MIKTAVVAVIAAALTVSFGASSKPRDVPDIPNTGGPHGGAHGGPQAGPHGVTLADLPDIQNPGTPPHGDPHDGPQTGPRAIALADLPDIPNPGDPPPPHH